MSVVALETIENPVSRWPCDTAYIVTRRQKCHSRSARSQMLLRRQVAGLLPAKASRNHNRPSLNRCYESEHDIPHKDSRGLDTLARARRDKRGVVIERSLAIALIPSRILRQ